MLISKPKSVFKSLWDFFVGITMKHLLTLILATLACCNIVAQDVCYYTESSRNPDPIMRQHEAFMDAFAKYMQANRKGVKACLEEKGTTTSVTSNNDSILMEIVSSTAHEGCTTVTIAIGQGSPIQYAYENRHSENAEGEEVLGTTLLIKYSGESGDTKTASTHQYARETNSKKDGSGNVIAKETIFNYECAHIQNHDKEEQR